jgi:hypothetical protein
MAKISRATIIPVIRSATKTVVGAYNLGGFKGFLGDETSYTLPSGKVITIQKWTPDGPTHVVGHERAEWIMACVIDEATFKSDSWQGYLEIVRMSDLMDSTQFVAATGLANRVVHTPGTLIDLLSFNTTIERPPINNVSPVAAGSTIATGTATCTDGTWVGGTIVYSYRWFLETGVASGVFAAISGATANTHVIASGGTGKKLFCRVTATDENGATSADSNQRTITA